MGKSLLKVKEAQYFYRDNILRALEEEGWFHFLQNPRTSNEIMQNFNYTESDLVRDILDTLVENKILLATADSRFQVAGEININMTKPDIISDALYEIEIELANELPNRLRGKPCTLTSGFNLYNWDDALTDRFYSQCRKSAFAFSGVLKKTGVLVDVGAGTGYGTAAMWSYYFKRNRFYPDTPMKIIAIEPDESMLKIGREEFSRMAAKHAGLPKVEIEEYSRYFPEFKRGKVEDLPFDDNSIDFIYTSQILHWTDAEKGIAEMLRVCKPGGFAFGMQAVAPRTNKFVEYHVKTVEDSTGFFTKKQFKEWALKAGAKQVKMAYPVVSVCYKFVK